MDTNVLSAEAPAKGAEHAAVSDWLRRHPSRLFLSTVTVVEVEQGIAKARREGAARRADALSAWLGIVLHLYGFRVLPLDVAAARETGALADRARASGQAPGLADLAIAGTARSRGLTVLTRNLRHFGPLGVPAMNPYDGLPP